MSLLRLTDGARNQLTRGPLPPTLAARSFLAFSSVLGVGSADWGGMEGLGGREDSRAVRTGTLLLLEGLVLVVQVALVRLLGRLCHAGAWSVMAAVLCFGGSWSLLDAAHLEGLGLAACFEPVSREIVKGRLGGRERGSVPSLLWPPIL